MLMYSKLFFSVFLVYVECLVSLFDVKYDGCKKHSLPLEVMEMTHTW